MRVAVIAGLWALMFASGSRAADGELHTFDCLDGCPLGASATNDVVVREIYTLSSNDLTKVADWVAYRITPETVAASKGIRDYKRDPVMDPSETLDESHTTGHPPTSISTTGIKHR